MNNSKIGTNQIFFKISGQLDPAVLIIFTPVRFLILLTVLSYYQKRAILPYVLYLVTVAMFVGRMEPNEEVLQRILHRCFLPSLALFGQAVSEEKIFITLANQKQELPLVAIFVGGLGRNEENLQRTLYRCFLPSLVPFGPVVSEEQIKI